MKERRFMKKRKGEGGMRFTKLKKATALIMCVFMLGSLLKMKEASAAPCYNHDMKKVVVYDATCSKNGRKEYYCSKCGKYMSQETLYATGVHSWGGWIVDKPATCTEAGTRHRKCNNCSATDPGTINATGHNNSGQQRRVDPTCGSNGYTVSICSNCGCELGSRSTLYATGNHSWGGWIVDKPATCTEAGTQHRKCNNCGATSSGTISATGHNSNGQVKRVEPTCSKDGYAVATCSKCGTEVGNRSVLKATGNHSWGGWIVDKAATCTTAGTKHRKCNNCGATDSTTIKATGHNSNGQIKRVEPTCSKDGYTVTTCSNCGTEVGNRSVLKATGNHSWGSWIVDKAATCTAAGTKHRKCNKCGATDSTTIKATGHNSNGQIKRVEPTCSKDGYTVTTCSNCGAEVGNRSVLKATGNHSWGSWIIDKAATCTAAGTKHRKCNNCGTTDSTTIKATGHNSNGQIKKVAATCGKDGYSVTTCSVCGAEVGSRSVIKATGKHSWGTWIDDKKPTCEQYGTHHRSCNVCGAKDSENIDPLGHSIQGQQKRVEPTCGKDGYSVTVCSTCGKEMGNRSILKATGKHDWGTWIDDKKANCTEAGTQHRKCNICGATDANTVKALGHSVNGQIKRVEPTCNKDGYSVTTCSTCGKEIGNRNILPKTGKHKWGSWERDKDASCVQEGLRHRVCEVCGEVEEQTLPKLRHNIQGQIKTISGSCVEDSYKVVVCSNCGEEIGNRIITKTAPGHKWGDWIIDKAPTTEEDGSKHHTCDNCGLTEEIIIRKMLKVTPGALSFNYISESKEITVINYEQPVSLIAVVSSDASSWASVRLSPGKTSTYTVSVDANKNGASRTGHIEFIDKNSGARTVVEVTQRGYVVSVSFDANGGYAYQIGTRTYQIGLAYRELPAGPTPPQGKEFIGWYTKDGELITTTSIVDGNITTLYAHYANNVKVTIRYDVGEGEGKQYYDTARKTVIVGDPYGQLEKGPHHPRGLRFIGWKDKGGRMITEKSIVEIKEDHVLYAAYDFPDHYTIHFDGNGSLKGHMEDKVCKYDTTYSLPPVGFDGGKGFIVWGLSPDGKEGFLYDRQDICNLVDKDTAEITLYAIWDTRYSVTYHYGVTGGVAKVYPMAHICLIKGSKLIPEVSIEGLRLVGWSDNKNVNLIGGKVDYELGKGYIFTENIDLYPVYELEDAGKRVILYNDNGGTGGPGVQFFPADDKTFTISGTKPSHTIYEFKKWKRGICEYQPNTTANTHDHFDGKSYIILTADWGLEDRVLTLDYCYDGKIVKKTVRGETKKLPTLKNRKGYEFKGWGEDRNTAKYEGGSKIVVPKGGITLYAVWENLPITVSVFNPFTFATDYSVTLTVESEFPGDIYHIDGLSFTGWTDDMYSSLFNSEPFWKKQISLSPKYYRGEKLSKIGYKKRITLYPCYTFDKDPKNCITALYVVNDSSVSNIPTAGYASGENESITISALVPHKDGCDFAGWNYVVECDQFRSGKCNPGATIKNIKKGEVVLLYPTWKTTTHLYLDLNYEGAETIDISGKFLPGTKVLGADLYDINLIKYKGHYIKGWATMDGEVAAYLGDTYVIPSENTTLYAIWGEYTIYYFNGFTGAFEYSETAGYETYIRHFPHEEAGYTFVGWVEDKNHDRGIWSWGSGLGLYPFTCKPDYIPNPDPNYTPKPDEIITLKQDIYLYSCFEEIENDKDGKVMVCYNASGGVGGPGIDYFDPKTETYEISWGNPHKDGFDFLGWSTSVYADKAEYVAGKPYTGLIPQNNKLNFYAVWVSETTNNLKQELQTRFGKELMPDLYFDTEYQSSSWEKVNDHCYFIIMTEVNNKATIMEKTHSTVFIIDYTNSKWRLEALGLAQSINSSIKFDILTKNSDFWGRAKLAFYETAKTAISIYVPTLGVFIRGVDFLSAFEDVAISYGKDEKNNAAFVLSLTDYVVDIIKAGLEEEGLSDKEITKRISDGYDIIKAICDKALTEDYKESICEYLQLYVDASKIIYDSFLLKKVEKELEKLEGEITEEVLRTTTEEMRKLDSDFFDLNKSNLKFTWSISFVAINQAIDIARNSKYTGTDPFGHYDVALGTFKDTISGLEFNDYVVNSFDSILHDIFRANYFQ